MAFTYSGDPASSDKDFVRFLTGDTLSRDPLLQDAEINALLAVTPDVRLASADACEAIAAIFSRQADTSNLGQSRSRSSKSAQYLELAKRLRKRAWTKAELFAGGLSVSGKRALAQDSDAIQPSFKVGQDDNFAAPELNDLFIFERGQ